VGTVHDDPLHAQEDLSSGRHCLACGEPLATWSRVDRRTCSQGCRTRLCRARRASRNASVTGTRAPERRSAGLLTLGPSDEQNAPQRGLQP